MKDSRWLYENDNEDEDLAAKLQVKVPAARGKHQIGAVKVPAARLKLLRNGESVVDAVKEAMLRLKCLRHG